MSSNMRGPALDQPAGYVGDYPFEEVAVGTAVVWAFPGKPARASLVTSVIQTLGDTEDEDEVTSYEVALSDSIVARQFAEVGPDQHLAAFDSMADAERMAHFLNTAPAFEEVERPHDRYCGCDSCTEQFHPGVSR